MNREFRLTLCLLLFCALPATGMAQGFGQPGVGDPRAKNQNDDKRDLPFLHGLHFHVPSGGPAPGPIPDDRPPVSPQTGTDFGRSGLPSPFDPPHYPGNNEPMPPGAFRPALPPEAHAPPRFEPIKIPTALEHTSSIPRFTGELSSVAAEGRGAVGLLGAVGAGIAAFFRGLFGRRKQ
jgi:hypothetical protein